MNLVQDFGIGYFLQQFSGAYFMKDEHVLRIHRNAGDWYSGNRGAIRCEKATGTAARMKVIAEDVPEDFFASFSTFSYPDLGWRTAANGMLIMRCEFAVGSYRRGLQPDNVHKVFHPFSVECANLGLLDPSPYTNGMRLGTLLMRPVYYSFAEGMSLIAKKKLLAFAVNADILVAPGAGDTYDIIAGEHVIGAVNADGVLTSTIPNIDKLLA